MKLSYGITVYNEAEELFRLTDLLINNIDSEDEARNEAQLILNDYVL